jgi:hypothetical protein
MHRQINVEVSFGGELRQLRGKKMREQNTDKLRKSWQLDFNSSEAFWSKALKLKNRHQECYIPCSPFSRWNPAYQLAFELS